MKKYYTRDEHLVMIALEEELNELTSYRNKILTEKDDPNFSGIEIQTYSNLKCMPTTKIELNKTDALYIVAVLIPLLDQKIKDIKSEMDKLGIVDSDAIG